MTRRPALSAALALAFVAGSVQPAAAHTPEPGTDPGTGERLATYVAPALAGEVAGTESFDAPATPLAAAADAQTVTVEVVPKDGRLPDDPNVVYLNLDTGDAYGVPLNADGIGSAELPPGRYDFLSWLVWDPAEDAPGDAVIALKELTVADAPQHVRFNPAIARPVSFTVDRRDARLRTMYFSINSRSFDGVSHLGLGVIINEDYRPAVIPTGRITDHETLFTARPTLTNPADARGGDAYRYNLVLSRLGGLPYRPRFTVKNADLARQRVEFHGLGGAPIEGTTASAAVSETVPGVVIALPTEVTVPSTMTQYFTADPGTTWHHVDTAGGDVAASIGGRVYEPGRSARSVFDAPLSVGIGSPEDTMYSTHVSRRGDLLMASPSLFGGSAPGQIIHTESTVGKAVLTRDGEVVGKADGDVSFLGFELPEGDAGRYTLSVEGARTSPWTPLGTSSTVEWQFDSASTDDWAMLPVSVVRLTAEGTVDGYAPRDEPQDVTLTYETQRGVTPNPVTDMAFEVSYDDGATWSTVDIDRDGGTATATLRHPAGAEFVSVRMSATDAAGNTVTHGTIRSYGLR